MKNEFIYSVKVLLNYDKYNMPHSMLAQFCVDKFNDTEWEYRCYGRPDIIDFHFKNIEDALIFKLSTDMVYND